MKYDLHIHSKYSYDSFLKPDKIIKIAKKRSLKGIAITDHNTIKGGLKALRENKDKEFDLIIGAEIKTDLGDIIGLFLNEEIKSRRFYEVIDEIKSQDGLTVLPHPYRQHKNPEKMVDHVDLIEGFNARTKKIYNDKSCQLAKGFECTVIAGSDAHLAFEIGRGLTIVKGEIRKSLKTGRTEINGRESNYYLVHGLSLLSEKIKNWY
jgi:predicted metal-dependent phosphoesterase TrpH